MTAEHTPEFSEPLHRTSSGKYIRKTDGDWPAWNVCEMNTNSGQFESDGERIVMCWNALAGIPSEQIERDAKLYPHVRDMAKAFERAEEILCRVINAEHYTCEDAINDLSDARHEVLKGLDFAKLGDDQ